jgi:hypothetical protein
MKALAKAMKAKNASAFDLEKGGRIYLDQRLAFGRKLCLKERTPASVY